MTTEHAIRFVMQRPFEPFIICLIDGRELHIPHWGLATMGAYGGVVFVTLPTRQIEVVDTELIVSIRTIYASQRAKWGG